MNERLIEYIKKSVEMGYGIERIRTALLDAGHNLMVVEEHLSHVIKAKQNEKLKKFIKRHVKNGHEAEKIKQALLRVGHDVKIVEEYVNDAVENQINKKQKIRKYALISAIALAAIITLLIGIYLFSDNSYKNAELTVDNTQAENTVYQENIGALNKALIANDSGICNGITELSLRSECKNKFNASLAETELNESSDALSKKLLDRAMIEHNASICFEIADLSIKATCEQILKK